MAVLFFREVFAGFGEGGTAAVETVGVVYTFAAGLVEYFSVGAFEVTGKGRGPYCLFVPAYPPWYYYSR